MDRNSMLSPPFVLRVLFALSLALMLAGLWQASALRVGVDGAVSSERQADSQVMSVSLSCVFCAAENKLTNPADHAHEPPSLVGVMPAPAYPTAGLPSSDSVRRDPVQFIALIERPPRRQLLI